MSKQNLSPVEKVAILLIALGEDIASNLFKKMPKKEVARIGSALSRMRTVDQSTCDAVLHEFLELLQTQKASLPKDGVTFARRAIELAFQNETGYKLIDGIEKSQATLRSIERAEPATLARILWNEHPQTKAMVLAHAKPALGAAILRTWPEAIQEEVLRRVAQMGAMDPDIIIELDAHLSEELERVSMQQHRKVGGLDQAAAILNHLQEASDQILDGLEERDPQLAEEIRQLMFTFEDLSLLDARVLGELANALPRNVLILALRGESEAVTSLFYTNMSSRSANLLREDIEALGPRRKEEIQKAQREILDWVQRWEQQGKIVIERGEKRTV